MPGYGYRRVWALLRRTRERQGATRVNVKRVYRVMGDHALLLERKAVHPRPKRRHDGNVAGDRSNQRWCSDGFEFRCDNGEPLRVTFARDCSDLEAMSRVARTGVCRGSGVREVMLGAVGQRFDGALKPPSQIEWLTDSGSGYIAQRTLAVAAAIGLRTVTTRVCSPQRSAMADSYVKTMKRDYIVFMPKPDVPTAMRHLAIAFEHYNEFHPHSAALLHAAGVSRRAASSTQG